MEQTINLYPLLSRPKKSFLTLRLMAISYGAFFLILFLNFSVSLWAHHALAQKNEMLNKEMMQIQMRAAEIKLQYPTLDTKDLENSVRKLQIELTERSEIYNLLAKNNQFSYFLVGLAKASVSGLWLTDITLALGKRDITLTGYALQINAVQDFLSHLEKQEEFMGYHFQLQEVKKVESPSKKEMLLNFVISSKVDMPS